MRFTLTQWAATLNCSALRHLRTAATALSILVGVTACSAEDAEVALGRQVYVNSGAGCHGPNLEGQPNWMERLPSGRLPAPPHDATGHTWHHSDAQLFRIVKEGLASIAPGYETDMPAFGGLLSDEDITAVIEFIKSTWPDREREFQRSRR